MSGGGTVIHTNYVVNSWFPGPRCASQKETMISFVDGMDEVLAAYIAGDGILMCNVGFLQCHLALHHVDDC